MSVRLNDLKGKMVIDLISGSNLGYLDDIRVSPDLIQPVALVISRGMFFNRSARFIPAEDVKVWGKDAILVEGAERSLGDSRGERSWLSVTDRVRNHFIISSDGRRVGQIQDVLVDEQGRLTEYELSQVFVTGRLAKTRTLPVQNTRSIGKDVIIVDLGDLADALEAPAAPKEVAVEGAADMEDTDTQERPQAASSSPGEEDWATQPMRVRNEPPYGTVGSYTMPDKTNR